MTSENKHISSWPNCCNDCYEFFASREDYLAHKCPVAKIKTDVNNKPPGPVDDKKLYPLNMEKYPLLDSIRICPKCKYEFYIYSIYTDRIPQYQYKKPQIIDLTQTENFKFIAREPDYVLRTCGRCGYQWRESCADTEKQ